MLFPLFVLIAMALFPQQAAAIEWTNITCDDITATPGTLIKQRYWNSDGVNHNFTQNDTCQFGCTNAFGFGVCKDGESQPIPTEIYLIFEIFGLALFLLTLATSQTAKQKLVYPAVAFFVFAMLSVVSFNVGPLGIGTSNIILPGVWINLVLALVCLIYIFGMAFGFIKEEVDASRAR